MSTKLIEVNDNRYESQDGRTVMARESVGESPNGNPFGGRWVLRVDGEYIDHDQYRHDLMPRHGLVPS